MPDPKTERGQRLCRAVALPDNAIGLFSMPMKAALARSETLPMKEATVLRQTSASLKLQASALLRCGRQSNVLA